jgi:hypothetical protein
MSEAMQAAIARNRREKAKKLARHIVSRAAEMAGKLTDEEWNHCAAACGVSMPSEETAQMVVEILEEIAI